MGGKNFCCGICLWILLFLFFIDVIDIHVNCLYMSVTNTKTYATLVTKHVDPLHKWHPNLTDNTHRSLASHSFENSFVLKH